MSPPNGRGPAPLGKPDHVASVASQTPNAHSLSGVAAVTR
jgi:hypothetical protein